MNWIDIAWPVMGGACLMLGLVHALAWIRRPQDRVHLVFALACLSVATISAMERMMMYVRDPHEYAELLRWAHVAGTVMFVSLALFVHLRFSSSRAWLCAAACGMRLVSLVINFTTGDNINFTEVTRLEVALIFGGVETAVPVGVVNPWMIVGQLGIVVFVAYLVDTMLREWRLRPQAERWPALRVCGGIAGFTLLVNSWRVAVVLGFIHAPDALVPGFLLVVFVMSNELGAEILRSADLSRTLSHTREQLRESEIKAEVAARAGELGLWGWDAATGKQWVTDLGLGLLGFSPGQPFRMATLLRRIQREDRAGLRTAMAAAREQGGEFRVGFRLRAGDGSLRHLSVRGQAEAGPDGAPTKLHGIIADVTERVQQEERFQLAVEASPTAMLMTRRDGAITLANRQAEVVFGYSRSELLSLSVDDLVPERFRARHRGHIPAYLDDPSARLMGSGLDLRGRRKDGTDVPIEVALNPIRVGSGQFVLASIADISERRRLESEAARHRDELAHLSRVALLAELSGSLAHELNQPLTAILSNAQAALRFMAMDPPNLGEVSESLVNIVESDKRAGEVIRRLRAMLRKEAADHRELDMNEVVADVLRIIRSDLLNKNTETVLELDPRLPVVWGDRIQLQQVLLNLITNGCDAMKDVAKGRALVIRTRGLPDRSVEVSVRDYGRGIVQGDLETIFQPFVSTKADGMGLGLAVCMTIIESHHGKLWAGNNDGPGATVHFRLPAADAATPPRS
ncbi:MAG TPA: PAS domain S-box protein [Arenimonas sp.]|nr:PAS domain S-box protein [Arenimonas sp.]